MRCGFTQRRFEIQQRAEHVKSLFDGKGKSGASAGRRLHKPDRGAGPGLHWLALGRNSFVAGLAARNRTSSQAVNPKKARPNGVRLDAAILARGLINRSINVSRADPPFSHTMPSDLARWQIMTRGCVLANFFCPKARFRTKETIRCFGKRF